MGKPEEEKRNQMMQNLFGDQSEDEEEEEEVDSGHIAASNHPDFHSDEGEGEAENDGEGEGEGEGEVEGLGEVEMESEAEAHDMEAESEGERIHTSQERETSYMRVGGEGKEDESEEEEEEEGYGQRVVTSRRREVFASESEGSEDNHFDDLGNEDEVDQTGQPSASPGEQGEQKDHEVVRDVFGDSDEDQPTEYGAQNELDQHSNRSPMEEDGNYQRDLRPEDIVPDEDAQYESEDENIGQKSKEKPVGPPLDMEILMRPPPGHPDRMNMIKVSNIMGIEAKAFDPKTYVEEDVFVTDESGTKKRIRLEDNIVRWRSVKNRNGTTSYESNARFVKWSDGSLQLLIGNEVLDISVQEANHDQAHLFLRHEKGILQSQGRLLRKMRFMPSSLSSKSHRLLTALVDSRHKKVYKVKNCVTDIDPEREKEEKEKVEGQSIKANELLHRKRAQVTRKYTQNVSKDQQLSTGYLEDALDEEDEREDYGSRRPSSRRRFEDDFDGEAQAEKRINNAKRVSRKPSLPSARPSRKTQEDYSESEREESEYETDGEDIENSPQQLDHENEYASEEAEEEAEAVSTASEGEPRRKVKEAGGRGSKRQEFELEDSPPQKAANNRRKSMVFDSDED